MGSGTSDQGLSEGTASLAAGASAASWVLGTAPGGGVTGTASGAAAGAAGTAWAGRTRTSPKCSLQQSEHTRRPHRQQVKFRF